MPDILFALILAVVWGALTFGLVKALNWLIGPPGGHP